MSLCLCCICSYLWPFFLVREGPTPHMTTFTHDLGPLSTLSTHPLPKPLCDLLTSTPPYASVQFSRSVVSNSLRPHGLQHARPPCRLPTPRVYLNSCPLSQWGHPTISSSVIPFSSCPQSFPASGSFQMSQLFESGGQSIGVSASASVLPVNTQDWSLG